MVDHNEIARKMKFDYLHAAMDKSDRNWESILSLLHRLQKPQLDLNALLLDAANIIHKQIGIANVAIGLKGTNDNLFRYRVLVGFRKETEDTQKKVVYTEEQFLEDSEYKGTMISKVSKLYLAEDKPYKEDEISTYDRSALLGMRRMSSTHSLEADYMDTWITGVNDEIIGWVETSGTIYGKIPDILAVKQIESIASIIGVALIHHGAVQHSGQPLK